MKNDVFSNIDFDERKKLLKPTFFFSCLFFILYYSFFIIPTYGINSTFFIVDNLGGSLTVLSFLLTIYLSSRIKNDIILMIPSLACITASVMFLGYGPMYEVAPNLWLSAQIMGMIFGIFFVTPRLTLVLLFLNILVPFLVVSFLDHIVLREVIISQAIVYYAGIVSVYLTYSKHKNKKDLIASNIKAIKAENIKTQFLANMSHEIRTPMNGVMGVVDILAETDLNKEQKEMLATVKSCGESLMVILNDILDLSKIQTGKVDLKLVNFNLVDCIQQVVSLMSYMTSQKDVHLDFIKPSTDKNWFVGDAQRIRQIIVNFLSNAIKFTQKGSIEIFLYIKEINPEECKILIEIKDTGIGISKEAQQNLFTPFTQVDSSITKEFSGTGLGLSISKELAQRMGGEVFLDSEVDVGSTFSFSITLKNGTPQSEFQGIDPKVLTDLDSSSTPHDILVVEDNLINQKLIKIMLEKLNYNCDIASNGQEALDLLGAKSYSIIFMDMQMPVMDGITATRKILEKYKKPAPSIIALTANAFKDDMDRCLEVGMVDFLKKPINLKDIQYVISKVPSPVATTEA